MSIGHQTVSVFLDVSKAKSKVKTNEKRLDELEKLICREKYENFDELTNTMLLELVDKVLVHERDKKYSQ